MVKSVKLRDVISAVQRLHRLNRGVVTGDIKRYVGGGMDVKRALRTAVKEGFLVVKSHRFFPAGVEEARRRRRRRSRRGKSKARLIGARRRRRSMRRRRRGRRHAESESESCVELVDLRRRRSRRGRRRRSRGRRHAGVEYVEVRRRRSRSRRRRRRRGYARQSAPLAPQQQVDQQTPDQKPTPSA